MAAPEHLEILRNGVAAWNQWRKEHPTIWPDLTQADFGGADLTLANLNRANLSRANFNRAILTGADLNESRLIEVNLSRAKLLGADLGRADLSGGIIVGAILSGAYLVGTDLSFADLSRTSLDGTDFSDCSLFHSIFADTDLSGAIGLHKVRHLGPSSIGVDSLVASEMDIPNCFLRGAGVPEVLIEYAASHAGKRIKYCSAFISYSSKDSELAERLYTDLQARGVRCWYAPEDLKIGDKFRIEIDRAIRLHDKLLLLLSENSISSAWVEKEVESAFDRENREKRLILFPVRLDKNVMDSDLGWAADIRRTRQIGDFSNWKMHRSYQKALHRLLRDLKADKMIRDVTRT